MNTDPSQNEMILDKMKALYKEFGISYFNPVFYDSRDLREKTLFKLGLTPIQHPKWTRFSWERQPFCTQEYLFIKFFHYIHTDWRGEKTMQRKKRYFKKMLEYYCLKMNFIKKEVYKYLAEKTVEQKC